MNNQDSDGLFDNDWDERSELSWTEVDWTRYLAEQDETVRQYLVHYEQLTGTTDRIDETARRMGWELSETEAGEISTPEEEATEADAFEGNWEPYTLHRNPVYISTQALTLSLLAAWERTVGASGAVPAPLALAVQASLYRGHNQALQAIQALDLGDYTLALCFFKRALQQLNITLAQLSQPSAADATTLTRFREFALPRLFDLREIWLRVMNECRSTEGEE